MPMTRPLALLTPLAALLATASPALSQTTVEAPVYKSWARVPVGTTVVQTSVTVAADGSKVASKTIQKLLSLGDDVAVVEQTFIDPSGEQFTQVFRERRRVPLLPGVDPEKLGIPPGATASGEEELEVAGRRITARWYDTTGQAEAGTMLVRTWFSDEIPGLIAKSVTRIEGREGSTTVEVVELNVP